MTVRRALTVATIAAMLAASVAGCGPKTVEPPVGVSDKPGASFPDRPVTYAFDTLDERPVSSAAHRGKPTILAFITTGDIVGQAQIDYLVAMAKNDGAKVNYALLALHPRKEIMLVEAYTSALKVEFPVALADPSVMTPQGPFGEFSAVPTIIILDREGRIVWKHTGLAKADELRGHMHRL
ncbi:MAG: hypothetical protein JWO86_1127 [Myxococcaceae bacterium]|jgi:hypothetical protein|nr:hypothetical protein [Myxococcaceae bacterium]MEA2753505.1 hypothetical protein [Myxococcales bacterium]